MRKKINLIILCLLLVFTFAACGTAQEPAAEEKTAVEVTPFEKHVIAYPENYETMASGASSYDGIGDHFNSPYFIHPDYYNMKSNDTLTIISNFETYQQTTEYSCGSASSLMVLNQYDISDYDELEIVKMSGTSDETGINPEGLVKFFTEIGWTVESNLDNDGEYTFEDPALFTAWVTENLSAETPIMVDWLDWAGHWQVIIGYDTMGTEDHFGDDVIIFADPYDTSDQYQDGYYTFPAERFFYMWREGVYTGEGPQQQPWVIATPAE